MEERALFADETAASALACIEEIANAADVDIDESDEAAVELARRAEVAVAFAELIAEEAEV